MTDAADAAALVRSDDGFDAFALPTRSGPHVTMQAVVVQAGRLTTTTSRDSLEAKVIRRRGTAAAALEHDDDTTEVVAGASVVAVRCACAAARSSTPMAGGAPGPLQQRAAGDRGRAVCRLPDLPGYASR